MSKIDIESFVLPYDTALVVVKTNSTETFEKVYESLDRTYRRREDKDKIIGGIGVVRVNPGDGIEAISTETMNMHGWYKKETK